MLTAKNFGAIFKSRRQELSLSLIEIEHATSIRSHYLEYIEDGQLDQLISSIYSKGFVKQYANFLGLDGEQLLRDHNQLFPKPSYQDFAYGIGTLEMRGSPSSSVRWLPNAILFGISFLLLCGAWALTRYFDLL